MALARKILKNGPHNHDHEWGNADIEKKGNFVYDLETKVPDNEVGLRMTPFGIEVPQIVNRLEDWNIFVAP